MKVFGSLLTFASLALVSAAAHASYATADFGTGSLNNPAGVNVVVAGQGLEDGLSWFAAAHSQAVIDQRRAPNQAVRMITAVDKTKKDAYLARLSSLGYKNIRYYDADFIADRLVAELQALPLISSLVFNGHDGAFLGFALEDEGGNHRFYFKDVDQMVGTVRFSSDAYIRLMGCNTGWYLAPYMAKKLGVPAAGTLTSSDVEVLASNNIYYYDENGQRPTGLTNVKCNETTGCLRLKPINNSYHGQHGVYVGALPFVKFFCGSVEQNDCYRRMALSTRFMVGNVEDDTTPDLKDYASTVADEFCHTAANPATFQTCADRVVTAVEGAKDLPESFTTLDSNVPQMTCDFQRCQFKTDKDDQGRQILVGTGPLQSQTFVNEVRAYRAGFALL